MNKKEIILKEKKSERKLLNKPAVFTILAIILIMIFGVAIAPVTLQNDTYYTIKIGEHITQNGIDMQDPFSWHEDLGYTYPHWGYDLITYYIYSAFGMTGIYVATCILSAILGASIYIINTKLTKNKLMSFVLTIGVMYLLKPYIAARAQLVTFILFAWTIYFIEKFIQTKKKRYVLGLIIIPIAIANLHIAVFPFYFVLYLPYIGEYLIALLAETIIYRKARVSLLKNKIKRLSKKNQESEKLKKAQEKLILLEEKVERVKIKRSEELRNPYKIKLRKQDSVKWLILIMIICIFTGLLTPLGTEPYTYLVKTMQGNTTQNISEHLPMIIANETEIISVIVVILAILILSKTKLTLSDFFMLSGLCYLMLVSRRQQTIFLIIGSIIVSRMLVNFMEIYDKGFLEKINKAVTSKIIWALMIIFMLIVSYGFFNSKKDDKYISTSSYPVEACDYILGNINLDTAKFYNEYNYGSYMLFRGIPVFIDSRADLYAPEFSGKEEDIFSDFIDISSLGKFYEDIFEKYGMTHIITYKNSKMNMIIKRTTTEGVKYNQLYEDDNFTIYERIK